MERISITFQRETIEIMKSLWAVKVSLSFWNTWIRLAHMQTSFFFFQSDMPNVLALFYWFANILISV